MSVLRKNFFAIFLKRRCPVNGITISIVTFAALALSGCIPLPSPTYGTINDKLSLAKPFEKGESILIYGKNASRPARFGEPYFTMGCMSDFQDDTVGQVTKYMLLLNPVPGQFSINTLSELRGEGPVIKFSAPIWSELGISEAKALQHYKNVCDTSFS